jgi:hypothetical protein
LRKSLIAMLLIVSVALFFLHTPLVKALSGEKIWGTPMTITQYFLANNNDEIPATNYAYVFQQAPEVSSTILMQYWSNMIAGDLELLRTQIESQIAGSKVQWLHISWKDVVFSTTGMPPAQIHWATVTGFKVEALVKNVAAGLTGAEIVLIIMAIAFLAGVIGLLAAGGWVTWRVITATEQLGPTYTILIGIGILVGIGFLVYSMFGGKVKYTSNKRGRRVELGK